MKTERLLLQRDVARNAPTTSWCARAAMIEVMAEFGQTDFGSNRFGQNSSFSGVKKFAFKGWSPKGLTQRVGREGWGPEGGRPKFRAFFLLSRHLGSFRGILVVKGP